MTYTSKGKVVLSKSRSGAPHNSPGDALGARVPRRAATKIGGSRITAGRRGNDEWAEVGREGETRIWA